MTEKDLIQPYANTLAVGRTSETIDAVWMRNSTDSSTTEAIAPFWFTGPENSLRSTLCSAIARANERVFISSSYLSEPTVIQAVSSAVERGVRTYLLLDTAGFEEVLANSVASPLHGSALIRERDTRGMDVALVDWHLPSKWGMVMACSLDLTLSATEGGWGVELDGEQIDEMQRHITHEFWSTKGTREVLATEEVSQPPLVAEAPFVLKPLLNGDFICRSQHSTEGHDASSEDAFRTMKKWTHISNSLSSQQSVALKGQLVEFAENSKISVFSNPEQHQPFTGAFAHSNASVLLAMGKKAFIAGWDRSAESDWGSLLMLNDDQNAAAKVWIEKHVKGAHWIGNDQLTIGDISDEILWNGRRMTVSEVQSIDLKTITLEEMPDSQETLESFKPTFELPMEELARSCNVTWNVQPPTLAQSTPQDSLHLDWENAKNVLSDRLSALDQANQPPKIALFGRKIKALQTKLDNAMEGVSTLRTVKALIKMKDEVEGLTQNILTNAKAMDEAEAEAEIEKAKEVQMKKHQSNVTKAEKTVTNLQKKLKSLQDEQKALTKQVAKSKKEEEKKRIKADLETLERTTSSVEIDLAKATQESTATFAFKPPKANTSNKKNSGHLFVREKDGQLLPLTVPAEDLPETGELYVVNEQRWLGIQRWSQIEIAKKEAKRLKAQLAVMEGNS